MPQTMTVNNDQERDKLIPNNAAKIAPRSAEADHGVHRTVDEIVKYAHEVVADNRASPTRNVALLAAALIREHERNQKLVDTLRTIDNGLLRFRTDVKQAMG